MELAIVLWCTFLCFDVIKPDLSLRLVVTCEGLMFVRLNREIGWERDNGKWKEVVEIDVLK